MDYILAIGYVETVMLEMKWKKEKEKLTMENIESRLSTLLDKKKEIIKINETESSRECQ